MNFEKWQFDHVPILYILDLGLKKCLAWKFIKIAKVSWENSEPFLGIKIFRPGRRMYMYSLPPVKDETK